MPKEKPRLYLQALDDHTNNVFRLHPLDESLTVEIRTKRGGEPIRAWEVTENELQFMRNSVSSASLRFNEYVLPYGERFARKVDPNHAKKQMIRAVRSVGLAIKRGAQNVNFRPA